MKDKKAEVGAHSTQLVTLGQLTFEHSLTVSQVSQTRKLIYIMLLNKLLCIILVTEFCLIGPGVMLNLQKRKLCILIVIS